ncbi:MAG TPA: class I SAM-dependent methyltransferase [Vicinamibacterales bacterium]|nr:class I SAM-dependent methyltransferase [Vicinamibacterales bacterium]
MRSVRAEYDAWAATYPAVAHNPVMRTEQAIVEPLLRRLAPRRALDVGSGSGRYLDVLAAIGATAVGVDFSVGMLKQARGARICGDARALPIRSASVDLVNASLMVGDVDDLASWTREMARVLDHGGHLVYSDFHPNWSHFGWRRTFRDAAGALHELPFASHTLAQHLGALADAGLSLQLLREPGLADVRDRSVRSFRQQWGDPSVVVVLHATKR